MQKTWMSCAFFLSRPAKGMIKSQNNLGNSDQTLKVEMQVTEMEWFLRLYQ